MPHWPRSSADHAARAARVSLWPAAIAVGIAGEDFLYGWGDARDWAPDLLTGWCLIGCGLIGWSRRADSRSGPLLVAAGFAWFVGDFSATGAGTVDWVAAHLLFLHRGPLVQLALTYPAGRARNRGERAVLAVAYASALVRPVWLNPPATIALAVLFLAAATLAHRRALGRERLARRHALEATGFLSAVLIGIAIVHLGDPGETVREGTLIAYEGALCLLAILVTAGLLRVSRERAAVVDLVVELSEARSSSLRDALAHALGDPTLEVAYRVPGAGTYVDASGRAVHLPRGPLGGRVTRLERDGREFAALVHDPAVLDDPALVEGIAAAARLNASNVQLRAEVRAQVAEVQASRRRLLAAGDEQRNRLERRLEEGAARRLAGLADTLARARDRARSGTRAKVEGAQEQLERSRADLRELATGLHPREVAEQGLASALRSLAERSPVPVELTLPAASLPVDLEATAYFVCSEALANVVKYAAASRALVAIAVNGQSIRVEVADDGIGGADASRGSGLRGLSDRIEAIGGTFRVASPPGGGTRLEAELPVRPLA